MIVISLIGLFSKACLRLSGATTYGMTHLQHALGKETRKGKGVLTLSNHTSVVDEPFMWGSLPISQYFRSRKMRWTLGASDIMFTNPLSAAFFTAGQVIETYRGKGVYQLAIEEAITKLDGGRWIHIFPEGKVNQPSLNPEHPALFRFKWGM
ncbi:hypothetical protein DL93DRAFT_2073044 [Clavulina sp. PMI_390]|nr:hypothetical protein DL93DRAFT_2073044 [Clavulina sp. PMI_390]